MCKTKQYTEEFKKQIVQLHDSGKSNSEIIREYAMAKSTLHKWINDYSKTGSFTAKDNRTDEEKEMIQLRKELKQLRMENDILKHPALIIGRK